MPRPVWFRLFGPNVPTAIAEFREALLNFQDGADGRSLANIRSILNLPIPGRPAAPDADAIRELNLRDLPLVAAIAGRPAAPGLDAIRDLNLRDLPLVAAAIAGRPELGTVVPDPGPGRPDHDVALLLPTDTAAANAAVVGSGPNDAAQAGNHPAFFVQVELPVPLAYGLAPITGDSASHAKREPNGWLEKYLQDHNVAQSITVGFTPDDPAPHWEDWAGPALGTLTLAGDYAGGFVLTALPFRVDGIVLTAGSNYLLASDDDFVAAGRTLAINAMDLGVGEHVVFDGTAESDGRFIFYGGGSADTFMGGAGDDLIEGRGGADILAGGDGSDTFVWRDAAESSGAGFDILADFDPATDRIDLEVEVSGFDAAIATGSLSEGSFSADLAAALAGLGAGRAVVYAPDAGDHAGTIFLVVDANGVAGYQEGEDYVFALAGTTLQDLSGHTGFFI